MSCHSCELASLCTQNCYLTFVSLLTFTKNLFRNVTIVRFTSTAWQLSSKMAYPQTMYGATEAGTVSPEVQQWFAAVDRDGSGRISASELQCALANGQGSTFSYRACKMMIDMFDKEKYGTINLTDFQALYNYVNAWLGVFRGYDHDGSGSIQENELSSALTQMGYRLSPEFISFLIKKSDPSGHRSMTVDQFIVLCVEIQRFTEAFRVRDTDQTGTINISFEDFLGVALSCSI